MDKPRLEQAKLEERLEKAAIVKKRKEARAVQDKLRKQQEEREQKVNMDKLR
jgi:hypothetical protein